MDVPSDPCVALDDKEKGESSSTDIADFFCASVGAVGVCPFLGRRAQPRLQTRATEYMWNLGFEQIFGRVSRKKRWRPRCSAQSSKDVRSLCLQAYTVQ